MKNFRLRIKKKRKFLHFEHNCPYPLKFTETTCRKLFTFICLQKINLIPLFFFFVEILQRQSKLILSNWAYLAMATKYNSISLWKTSMLIFTKKKNQIYVSSVSWSIAKYCKLVILGTLDMADHTH